MRKGIKEKILRQKRDSDQYRKSILNSKNLNQKDFSRLFFYYMCAKFSLEPEEITTDNFYEICQISAEKIAKMPHGELDAAENASKCGGATTAMNKKILFLLAVNREFGIRLSADDSVSINTYKELCECVYGKIKEKMG